MASRVVRSFSVDRELSTQLDAIAERRGVSVSELVNQLAQAGIRQQRIEAAQAFVNAGVGTAALTALLVLVLIL